MNYLSAGHFEIFTELENEARSFDERGIKLVSAIYPYLEQLTEIALWFNDRCDQLRLGKTKHEKYEKYRVIASDGMSYLLE